MLLVDNPDRAYRRMSVDARILGASQVELVQICFEQVVNGLGSAIRAEESRDATRRSAALTRAHAALIALTMGIDHNAPLAGSLLQLYSSAREAILASTTQFDAALLAQVQQDFREIADAFQH